MAVQHFTKPMQQRKAQIKMFETVGILVVFFFLLALVLLTPVFQLFRRAEARISLLKTPPGTGA